MGGFTYVETPCLFNQNQSCRNLVCSGERCLQHPENRIKRFHEQLIRLCSKDSECSKKFILDIFEQQFPEVK